MEVHACNSNLQEAQAGALRDGSQPKQYSENLSQKRKKNLELGAGEMVQPVRTVAAARPTDPCQFPAPTPSGSQLSVSSSRRAKGLWFLQTRRLTCIYPHADTHTYT